MNTVFRYSSSTNQKENKPVSKTLGYCKESRCKMYNNISAWFFMVVLFLSLIVLLLPLYTSVEGNTYSVVTSIFLTQGLIVRRVLYAALSLTILYNVIKGVINGTRILKGKQIEMCKYVIYALGCLVAPLLLLRMNQTSNPDYSFDTYYFLPIVLIVGFTSIITRFIFQTLKQLGEISSKQLISGVLSKTSVVFLIIGITVFFGHSTFRIDFASGEYIYAGVLGLLREIQSYMATYDNLDEYSILYTIEASAGILAGVYVLLAVILIELLMRTIRKSIFMYIQPVQIVNALIIAGFVILIFLFIISISFVDGDPSYLAVKTIKLPLILGLSLSFIAATSAVISNVFNSNKTAKT